MDTISLRKVPLRRLSPAFARLEARSARRGEGGARPGGRTRPVEGIDPLIANRPALFDLLSEILTVDRGTVRAYQVVLGRLPDEELASQLKEFLDQNLRQLDLLENAVRALGGEARHMSLGATLAQVRIHKMLELGLPVPAITARDLLLADLQTLIMLETQRRDNWEFLRELVEKVGDEMASELVIGPVGDSNMEQELHIEWILGAINTLWLKRLSEECRPGEGGGGG